MARPDDFGRDDPRIDIVRRPSPVVLPSELYDRLKAEGGMNMRMFRRAEPMPRPTMTTYKVAGY
jgi:hypothetical protein